MGESFSSTFWEGGGWEVVPSRLATALEDKDVCRLLNAFGTNGETNKDSSHMQHFVLVFGLKQFYQKLEGVISMGVDPPERFFLDKGALLDELSSFRGRSSARLVRLDSGYLRL